MAELENVLNQNDFLASPKKLIDEINHLVEWHEENVNPRNDGLTLAGKHFCGQCGAARRHLLVITRCEELNKILLPKSDQFNNFDEYYSHHLQGSQDPDQFNPDIPTAFAVRCNECDAITFGLYCPIGNSQEICLIAECNDIGDYPKETPDAIAFYMREAAKCLKGQATSAAAAMYRAALEQILVHEGYDDFMLGNKINALLRAMKENKAPTWATSELIELIDHCAKIGNGSIHTNGGIISHQEKITTELLSAMRSLIRSLLDLIFEEPKRTSERNELIASSGDYFEELKKKK